MNQRVVNFLRGYIVFVSDISLAHGQKYLIVYLHT